jgi:hypothetical protein
MTRPPAPTDRTPERVLAIAGVGGLLLVFVVSIVLIASAAGGDDAQPVVAATATPTATAEPKATPTPKPKRKPLTAAERQERDAAKAIVESRGFEVVRLRDFDPSDTLRVLIGRTSSGGEMAFFFAGGDYLGNDSTDVSARLRVKRTTDLTTTLTYTVADPDTGDATHEDVRFTWDGAHVTPETQVPDASLRAPGAVPVD